MHIFDGHRDLVRIPGVYSVDELHRMLGSIVESPGEVFTDALDVLYFIKKG